MKATAATWAVVGVLLMAPTAAAGAPAVSIEAELRIEPSLERVEGRAVLRLENRSKGPLEHVDLWLFPERLRKPPTRMDEISEGWIFPEGFSPGAMTLNKVLGDDGAELAVTYPSPTLARAKLPAPLAVGAETTLTIDFTTRVPHRFGPFGHANGELALDGGALPRPPPLTDEGFAADAPPDPIGYRLSVAWGGRSEAWLLCNGRMTRLKPRADARYVGRDVAQRVTLVLLTEPHLSTLEVDGTTIAYIHRRPRRYEDPDGIKDLSVVDVHAQALGTVGSGLRFWRRKLGRKLPRRLVLVEVPLRREVAIGARDLVLVSDRAFELFWLERLRKFHRLALLRAVFGTLLEPEIRAREPFELRDRVRDLLALGLTERWEQRQYRRVEGVQELLSYGAFISTLDEAIYAPQFPMQHVYFRTPDDTDPYRDRFDLFSHAHPNGSRLHEKLRELEPATGLAEVVDALLSGATFRDALARHLPAADAAFQKRWSGAYPTLNYKLGKVQPGRDEQGHFVDVEVLREGDTTVKEPVRVTVVDAGSKPAHGTWHAAGERGRVRIRTEREADEVVIDAHGRKVESDLGRSVDARFDNRNYGDWKFLVDSLTLSFSSADGRFEGALSTILQNKHDLAHLFVLAPFEAGASTGLTAGWSYGFGEKVRANRLRYHFAINTTLQWLKPLADEPQGFGAELSVSLSRIGRLSARNPKEAVNFYAEAGAVLAWRGGDPEVAGYARAGVSGVFEPASGHVLGGRLQLASLFGRAATQQEWTVGGPNQVRAYDLLARTGRYRILANLEWRHRYSRDLLLNVAGLGFVYSIHGVVFVDAALLSDDIEELFSERAIYLGVGYGFRFHYQLFGMTPLLIRLDLAVPLPTGAPLDATASFPLSVVLGVDQAF